MASENKLSNNMTTSKVNSNTPLANKSVTVLRASEINNATTGYNKEPHKSKGRLQKIREK